MAMPSRLDFSEEKKRAWLRGDTIPAMPFTITEDDGDTPVDLTGAQIVMDIYERIDGAVLARLRTSNAPAIGGGKPEGTITVSNAAGGIGQVDQVPPSVTNALIPSKSRRKVSRWYTFEITWAGSPDVVITPFGGTIDVLPDGT